MKSSTTVARLAGYLSWIIALILVLLPFHAFLTVWGSSIIGHYTLARLWKEILLVPVFIGAIYILLTSGRRKQFFNSRLVQLIIIYSALILLTAGIALARHTVNTKAAAYGTLVDLRFLIFFLMVMVITACSPFLAKKWRELLILPATLVIIFGLLQYWVLPYDFLRHLGYGSATISPYETINNNIHHLRIASTLRGANPLGAYLVLIISAAGSILASAKIKRPSQCFWLLGALLALIFSYSRSAWIGALLSIVIIVWLSIQNQRAQRLSLILAGCLVVICGVAGLILRQNATFQDAILHTDNNSKAVLSSNENHTSAFKNGLRDIVHQPLGEGPGTAGPASAYNNHPGRIAENYFLQVGQEAGVIGMALFIAINVMVGRLLWQKRKDPLALALLASLIGLSFVNLLSHAWADDTLAYIWWGLAAVALAPHYHTTGHSPAHR